MQAFVYKSQRKADTYVYLAKRDDFEPLPEALKSMLGGLQFVLELELSPERKLARVDAASVMTHLQSTGFFVQMPPTFDFGSVAAQDIAVQNSKMN